MEQQRIIKALLTAMTAAHAGLAGLGNAIDYPANFGFVQHVLMMDTLFRGPVVAWRAVTAPALHHIAYITIIVAELSTGLLGGSAAFAMIRGRRDGAAFARARRLGCWSALLAVAIWYGGFEVIGGEWFLMWQSATYNAQQAAFLYVVPNLALLMILLNPEHDRA